MEELPDPQDNNGQNQPLRVLRISDLPPHPPERVAWLIEELWADQAVGVIGGAPKCCKTFLALEMAIAVASGKPCLGRFPVAQPGPVLLYAAEDSPAHIRSRLQGLADAHDIDFKTIPVFIILAPALRLDLQRDKIRLEAAIEKLRPRLLILDPFVRLHRLDENSAMEVSALLADLRSLQRRFELAIILVHHTRKANTEASGQALRGSGDLHAWGDSNLYIRRSKNHLTLCAEHRAARAPDPIAINLTGGDAPHIEVNSCAPQPQKQGLDQMILNTLKRTPTPLTQFQLRSALKVRNQSISAVLRELLEENKITRSNGGWTLKR